MDQILKKFLIGTGLVIDEVDAIDGNAEKLKAVLHKLPSEKKMALVWIVATSVFKDVYECMFDDAMDILNLRCGFALVGFIHEQCDCGMAHVHAKAVMTSVVTPAGEPETQEMLANAFKELGLDIEKNFNDQGDTDGNTAPPISKVH